MTNRDDVVSDLRTVVRELMMGAGSAVGHAEQGEYRDAFGYLAGLDQGIARLQVGLLELMRADGLTWQQIGDELGVSRQAAQKRYRLAAA